jgi:protein O-GlcNAcase/histone acetyltransferase
MTPRATSFLSGVIEGFYGKPWSPAERLELFDWMSNWGLNTYVYAPKDDLHHRALWREPYSPSEAEQLAQSIEACGQRRLRFIYGLSPGLDLEYGTEGELGHLIKRFEQILSLGCGDFSLLFDDIPLRMATDDTHQWDLLASAQCHLANALFRWTRERRPGARFVFCPTAYCGRMAESVPGAQTYLVAVGRELQPDIEIVWTGPEIISREIPVSHVQELQPVLQRKPLIWDNLHANDYDGRRFFCGPYSGRLPALRNEVSGMLLNPNNEFLLNYVPLRTLAAFMRCQNTWDARTAYLAAMEEWLQSFATISQPIALDDLVLFGDCYYLPHEEGPEAEALYRQACELLRADRGEWGEDAAAFRRQASRLRELCDRMTEVRHRPLFYALSRRIWELREELDLLAGYVEFRSATASSDTAFRSPSHIAGTYRGGIVARLQRLLTQRSDGAFIPSDEGDGR